MPHCPFCDRNHKRKPNRGEHVIPKWISREFPNATWLVANRLTGYIRESQKYINITTAIPCTNCDNVWMSDLEKVAGPILKPLIHGQRSILTLRDQQVIVWWMFKTAAMFDLHSFERAPRPRYFPDNELRIFARTGAFNPAYQFYVGKYSGAHAFQLQETHSTVEVANTRTLIPESDPLWGYALTIVIEKLVLQSFCAKVPTPLPWLMQDFRPFAHQIASFPPMNIQWPPPLSFRDQLIQDFVERWATKPPATST